MAFNDIEIARYKREVKQYVEKKRPPANIRKELDIGFLVKGQSVEIFEIRPCWDNPEETLEHPVAKATFVKSQQCWKVFWQRRDLKWHRYDPMPVVNNLQDFLVLVEDDDYACFWG